MPQRCHYSTSTSSSSKSLPKLTHQTSSGAAHMVPIASKPNTHRIAKAVGYVVFSNVTVLELIRANTTKKGDVLSVARIAGIMAAKRTPEWIPLCHAISLSSVKVEFEPLPRLAPPAVPTDGGRIRIQSEVECDGKTGVEMEALTAVSAAALTIFDMCKAVDRAITIEGVRVIYKAGGRSGTWEADLGVEEETAPA